jgi:Protein of unknown function (DUF3089)
MCARRFLILVFALTLIVVAGAFAIFQWGGEALLKQAIPKGHFAATAAGGGPDYAQASSWVTRPGEADDLAQWTPEGERLPDPITRVQVAVFYVHPTTYLERDRWNAPLQPGGETEFRTRLFVQSQASAFGQLAELWAPRYRQAAFGAFLLKSEDAGEALDFAYRDVAAAFDEFLKQVPEGPIILAGHSQGALHLERLLRERVAGKPIAKRIVAAYVVGWPIDVQSDLPALGLPACTAATQTGCMLSWMTFGEPANPDLILGEWEKTQGLNGGKRSSEDVLCVNPLTGTKDGAAPPQDNPGTLVPTADLTSATVLPQAVGARCDKGLLLVSGNIPSLGPYELPGNNYHVYDYALFWGAIRADAERRIAAWRP